MYAIHLLVNFQRTNVWFKEWETSSLASKDLEQITGEGILPSDIFRFIAGEADILKISVWERLGIAEPEGEYEIGLGITEVMDLHKV